MVTARVWSKITKPDVRDPGDWLPCGQTLCPSTILTVSWGKPAGVAIHLSNISHHNLWKH